MTKKPLLRPTDRNAFRWFELPGGPNVVPNAAYAFHFYLVPTEVCVIEPPINGTSGQPVRIRIAQGPTGYAVTLHSPIASIGTVTISASANAVTDVVLVRDELDVWRAVGIPDLSATYDAAGTAAAAIVTHEAAADPHTQYLQRNADNVVEDGVDFAFNPGTGSKIGTGPTEKIGKWGVTPVVQPAAIADATDAASTMARLNDLLAALRLTGEIGT